MNSKTCNDCGEDKPATEEYFYRARAKPDGLRRCCKPCAAAQKRKWRNENPEKVAEYDRRYKLRKKYGISPEEWEEILDSQGRVCAACGTDEPGTDTEWHTDHDHDTGMIRGILCGSCNRTLGHAKESPARLRSLVDYLKEAP